MDEGLGTARSGIIAGRVRCVRDRVWTDRRGWTGENGGQACQGLPGSRGHHRHYRRWAYPQAQQASASNAGDGEILASLLVCSWSWCQRSALPGR